ncbi:MAG: cobyrinate a,c-diamide synthase [Gracilibacteraceae bacterium]|jgi:cobyrinic acid a,c-diamide synthase|nr:cobyrinate a,c-diamide synthase [Gracilibacteraceae bacterium]
MKAPRFVISAPNGRSGKTTLTLGILRAFRRQGLRIQPCKKGPDFIDPSWHALAAGREGRSLDPFFLTPEQLRNLLATAAEGADLTLIEGAMGLFDGLDADGSCSTAEVAKQTESPVVLVLNVRRQTRTAAAVLYGLQRFDPDLRVAGVILNEVSGSRQENLVRRAITENCDIPVLGALPYIKTLTIPDRHLGLVTAAECAAREEIMEAIADAVCQYVDLKALRRLAKTAPPLPAPAPLFPPAYHGGARPKLAVFRDRPFTFYYPENLEALANAGAELDFVNSLEAPSLPDDTAGLYIGGGFPETAAKELAANTSLLREVRGAAEQGLPIYAECGGLMYLCRSLRTGDNTHYPLAGVLPADAVMGSRRQGHGYTVLRATAANSWFPGLTLRGHEFHYSQLENIDHSLDFAYNVEKGRGLDGAHEGFVYKNVHAAYTHIQALAVPSWAPAFVERARGYAARGG